MESSDTALDLAIDLTWQQKVAAHWSIYWPTMVLFLLTLIILLPLFHVEVREHVTVMWLAANSVFFTLQAIVIRRLVRKNYRSFRVEIVRDDGQRSRTVSMRPVVLVWLGVLLPLVALVCVKAVAVAWV